MDAFFSSLRLAAHRRRQRTAAARPRVATQPVTAALLAIACLSVCSLARRVEAADLRTTNFIVNAPTDQLARAVGESAERYRRELAIYWTGEELPPWPNPCPIRVVAGSNLAAQGVTTYNRSPVRDFQMEVVGSPQRILDSVLPHEVTHTVLATYFGRPLPRWADEGICTTVEHPSERQKHETKLREFLRSRRGIAMNKLFLMTEYPSDVLPMYAQGYSVCQFLIAQQGPRKLVTFLGDYMQNPSWTQHVREHYGYESLAELQEAWLAWVADGSGPVNNYVKIPVSPAGSSDRGVGSLAAAGSAPRPTPSPPRPPLMAAPAPATDAEASIALASASPSVGSDGWYSRLRQRALAANNGSPGNTRQSAGPERRPPADRRPASRSWHSVSQPQPEQGLAPGGVVPASATSGTGQGYRPGSVSNSGSYWR